MLRLSLRLSVRQPSVDPSFLGPLRKFYGYEDHGADCEIDQ
jgi:hypothetical protein